MNIITRSERSTRPRNYFLVGLLSLSLLLAACLPEFPDLASGERMEQSPLLGALERKSGLIAFMGTDGNIYTVNQGGGAQNAVTRDAHVTAESGSTESLRYYQFPTWSPEGQQLAFIGLSGEAGQPPQGSIHTASPDGSDFKTVYSDGEPPFYLYWSPNAEYISFLNNAASGDIRLQLASTGEEETKLLDTGRPLYWAWAPNSRQLMAHIDGTDTDARLSVIDLEEPVVEEMMSLRPAQFQSPAWSPDGRYVLMGTRGDEGAVSLALYDRELDEQEDLKTFPASTSLAFAWSPDGNKIAYISSIAPATQGIRGHVTILDRDDPDKTIQTEANGAAAFFWSPDSEKIAYFDLIYVTPPGQESGGDTPSEGDNQNRVPVFRLNVLDVTSGENLEIMDPFVPTPQLLEIVAFFDQYQHSATFWSPDSKNVVTTAIRDNAPGIFVASATGSIQPRFLAPGVLAFWSRE